MSEIKVNKISPKQTCTTVTLGDSGDDFVVATGANLKTAAVKDTAGNVIVSRCGSNITIGSSGAAIALACGATQTGFGRTGTVDWDTTKITADPNPAVSGVGYFADTSSAAFTVTLPAAPSAGDIVALSDYTGTWGTNNITVGRNSSNINGAASDLILNGNNTTATLIYVDGTEGWRVIDTGSLSEVNVALYVAATGGTITTFGDYKIHTFTGPGTFTVCSVGNPLGSTTVDYIVVAGGGGGGYDSAGGGGAGGFRESHSTPVSGCYTASPLATPTGIPVSVTTYPVTVGGGGSAGTGPGGSRSQNGSNSVFSTITSAGGGAGASDAGTPNALAISGGSGGGGGRNTPGASGNTPPTSPPQGQNGGCTGAPGDNKNGGGGGATQAGFGSNPSVGGAGATTSISGSSTSYAGGGGGSRPAADGSPDPTQMLGGLGGGGNGGAGTSATAGSANTGGGGGGGPGNSPTCGAAGGSGIVIIRYKYQ
jgi:hypothetical protein